MTVLVHAVGFRETPSSPARTNAAPPTASESSVQASEATTTTQSARDLFREKLSELSQIDIPSTTKWNHPGNPFWGVFDYVRWFGSLPPKELDAAFVNSTVERLQKYDLIAGDPPGGRRTWSVPEPIDSLPGWAPVADAAEAFLLEGLDHAPPYGDSFGAEYAQSRYGSHKFARSFQLAVGRAARRGDAEKLDALFSAAVRFHCLEHIYSFPMGESMLPSNIVLLADAADGLTSDTLRAALDSVQALHLSESQYHEFWPAFVARLHRSFDDYLTSIERNGWEADMKLNTWHEFFDGKPEAVVSDALLPVARRRLEALMMAYAAMAPEEAARATHRYHSACNLMNIDTQFARSLFPHNYPSSDLRKSRPTAYDFQNHFDHVRMIRHLDNLITGQAAIALAIMIHRQSFGSDPTSLGELKRVGLDTAKLEEPGVEYQLLPVTLPDGGSRLVLFQLVNDKSESLYISVARF